jgi:hypothetical protein
MRKTFLRYTCGHLVKTAENENVPAALPLALNVDEDCKSCKGEEYCERLEKWADVLDEMGPLEWAKLYARFSSLQSSIAQDHPDWLAEAVLLEAERQQVEAYERGGLGKSEVAVDCQTRIPTINLEPASPTTREHWAHFKFDIKQAKG